MKRRITMVSAEEPVPSDFDETMDDLEEEYAEEEEVEEVSEEEDVVIEKYVPETFEQLSFMYRPKVPEHSRSSGIEELRAKMEDIKPKVEEVKPKIEEIKQAIEEIKPKIDSMVPKSQTEIKNVNTSEKKQELGQIDRQQHGQNLPYKELLSTKSGEVVDDDELSEGDEEESLNEEELISEEEEVSDVDDDDLMKRLDEKYGKLPQKPYDSEDEEEDNSWTST